MSDTDSFIDEVTEEVRRDRLFALMRKYGWIGILLVVLIVGGAAYTEWQKARAKADAEAFGDAVVSAMQSDDAAARVAGLDALAAEAGASGGRGAVLQLLATAEAFAGDDRTGAIERMRAVADDPAQPESLRQLAQLKLVGLAGADMPAAERDSLLAALALPGAPFRPLAMEQQALALMQAEKTDQALDLFRQLLLEPSVTAGLRRRATQLIVALGGEPDGA